MIEPINFLEREVFVFTYLKMVYTLAALCSVFVVLFGLQAVRGEILERKAARLTAEVNELKARREQLLASIEKSRGTASAPERTIRESLESTPPWSQTLRELARLMPHRLWLVSLKSYAKAEAKAERGLLLSGEAEGPEQISLFLKALGESPRFAQPLLTTSKEEKRGAGWIQMYTIDLIVKPNREAGVP